MTDYTKSTNFATKDNLSSGNPLKIVKGTEIDTEFNNIQTAVATKADLASPAFTGNPTAPTPTTGDNDTSVATTAFVQTALSAIYPVGSIYTNAAVSTNPATLLGFGTWTAFGAGRVMVGVDTGDTAFDTLGETGGSKDAITVSHTHTISGSTGAMSANETHTHTLDIQSYIVDASVGGNGFTQFGGSRTTSSANLAHTHGAGTLANSTVGSSGTNANLQPYITVYMWRRTA
jgi:hypothetical protein